MLSKFVVNKIDDHCATAVETTKLKNMGFSYGDIITFDKSLNNHLEKIQTKKELKNWDKKNQKITDKEKYQINNTIIPKCLLVNIGLKCVETNQRSKKDKDTLKTNHGKSYIMYWVK